MDILEKADKVIKFMECCLTRGGNCTRCEFYSMQANGCGKCDGYKKIGPLLMGYMEDIKAEISQK
jgi:hypothetical protein